MIGEEREKPCLPQTTLRPYPFLSKMIREFPNVSAGELVKSAVVKQAECGLAQEI
jgi:hypothetical protein